MLEDMQYRFNSDRAAAQLLDGEAVILHLLTGAYYSANGIGAAIWQLLSNGHTPRSIGIRLAATCGEPIERLIADAIAIATEAENEGLLVRATEAVEPTDRTLEGLELRRYTPPALQKHTDMEDLLALDPPLPARITSSGGTGVDGR